VGQRVLGEPVAVLLHELAVHTGGPELVRDGLYELRVSIPPDLGGALRRAILRATALELRRAAEEVRGSYARLDPHQLEAAAVLRVTRAVARSARETGLPARSLQEGALLLGNAAAVHPRRPGRSAGSSEIYVREEFG
jgi:hypothetical protein